MALKKKKLVAVVAGIAVFAAVSASAATLGGVRTDNLGANSNSVTGPIQNGVAVTWDVAYDAVAGEYVVNGATLATLDPLETIGAGAEILLAITAADGTLLTEVAGTGTSVVVPGVPAIDVYGVSVVVNGGSTTAAVATQ